MLPSFTLRVDLDTDTPAVSLSVTVTATLSTLSPAYSEALSVATACVMFWVSFTVSRSSAALTVTVWAVSQVAAVKVSEVGATVTSPPPVTSTVTSAVGLASSTSV